MGPREAAAAADWLINTHKFVARAEFLSEGLS